MVLGSKTVYMITLVCPSCDPQARRMLEKARQWAYHHKLYFMVVQQGNSRWETLLDMLAESLAPDMALYDGLPALCYRNRFTDSVKGLDIIYKETTGNENN